MKGISFTMPEDVFSLKGIFSITTQVLGLIWGESDQLEPE
jgi:hypothetical protein